MSMINTHLKVRVFDFDNEEVRAIWGSIDFSDRSWELCMAYPSHGKFIFTPTSYKKNEIYIVVMYDLKRNIFFEVKGSDFIKKKKCPNVSGN
ncbi:hypothetical protein YWS52_38680 [Chitiniphilus shinanonensis]